VRFQLRFLLAWGLLALAQSAGAETRVALVIGNANYADPRLVLANPGRDARAMDEALKAAGFKTMLRLDVKRVPLYSFVEQFGKRLASDPKAVGLFYYAGHGVQVDGVNYLIPVDAEVESDADLGANAFDVGRVLQEMAKAQNDLNIVILDACRDNPLPRTARGMTRGLAKMDPPDGTFIAYAAKPGHSAFDGASGTHGLFTGELVQAMSRPGVPLEQMFKLVVEGVWKKSGFKQRPWSEESVQGDFYFHPTPAALAIQLPAPDPRQAEQAAWAGISNSKAPEDFRAYLSSYPHGEHAPLAQQRLEALLAPPPQAKPRIAPRPPAVASTKPDHPPDKRCAGLLERTQVGDTLNEDESAYVKEKCN